MARTGLHSKDARRYVRVAQLALMGLGAMAVAMWVTDAGMSRTLPPRPQPEKGLDTPEVVKVAPKVPTIEADAPLGMQERLDLAAKHNKQTAAPPDPEKTPEPAPATPVVASGPEWKYLGRVLEPGRTLALVSIDGGQKFVPKGATIGMPPIEGKGSEYKAKLLDVEPDFISIKEGNGEPRRIALEARTAHVSWVKNIPVATALASVPSALSQEARNRLAAGQIDPA